MTRQLDAHYFTQCVVNELLKSDVLREQAAVNSRSQFAVSPDLRLAVRDAIITVYERNSLVFDKVINNAAVQEMIATTIAGGVYSNARLAAAADIIQ